MPNSRVIDVECRCGYRLFQYFKLGKGKLIKCYLYRILKDWVDVQDMEVGDKPVCPQCSNTIGSVKIIQGRHAIKLNQGTIKPIRVG